MKKFTITNKIDSVGFITKMMFPHWTRILIWSLQLEKSQYMLLYKRLNSLWESNGVGFLTSYSKECVRILQSYVSGHPILITNEFIVGLSGGLPSIIPGKIRSRIREGDTKSIRGCLSILQVYRVLKVPGVLKIGSIIDPFMGLSETLPQYEVVKATRELIRSIKLKPVTLIYLSTAGPNHPISMLGIWKDLIAWRDSGKLPLIGRFATFMEGSQEFLKLLASELDYLESYKTPVPLKLGKLSKKEEAAGKIRIFAISDAITQSVLKPLHDGIFDQLKTIPMDGTFDQGAPLKRLIDRVKSGDLINPMFYSYDLSSATDRLPIRLQSQVLETYFGAEFAGLWEKILIDRDWYLDDKPLRYSVGQPMGALSSWAMLALTHHMIVKLAARRLGITGFTDYALLGDDIVIANESVALAYHSIMTEILGVQINLSKSLKSAHSFEFAKRLITLDGEVSPVGAKNLLVGLKSLKGIPSILLDLHNKGVVLTEESVNQLYKSIPTVRKTQVEKMSWLVKGPFGFIPTADGLTASMKLTNSLSAVMMDSLLSSIDQALFESNLCIWEKNLKKIGKILFTLRNLPDTVLDFPMKDSPLLKAMIATWLSRSNKAIAEKPVRRFIFDGPLVFTNYYRVTWMDEMMKYITSKIKNNSEPILSVQDPFRTDVALLPLSLNKKSDNFWSLVRRIENEKSSIRGYKGW